MRYDMSGILVQEKYKIQKIKGLKKNNFYFFYNKSNETFCSIGSLRVSSGLLNTG